MVVKSLEIQDSVASDCVGGGVVVVPQHLMVSPGKEKGPKVNITLKCGGKIKESFDSPMPSESNISPMSAETKELPRPQRRSSARIQAKQKELEKIRTRRKAEVLENAGKSGENATASPNKCSKKSHGETSVAKKDVVSKYKKKKKKAVTKAVMSAELETKEVVKDMERAKEVVKDVERTKEEVMDVERTVESENVVGALADKGAAAKVKDTIRIFNKHYLHFVQDEENRCVKANAEAEKASKKGSKSKSVQNSDPPIKSKNRAKRPDLKAITEMMKNNEILFGEKRIGNIPGIEVGYQFYSRAEMVAVGFHSHWLNGIDYMGQSYSKANSSYEYPIAVAIVISGMYEDDLDNADDVVYTGQGGHNLTGNKRQILDQKLERGNLALKNCVAQCVPVRVIRGHDSASSYTRKVYTYDGLYKVVNYWAEKGISGFTVYKFRLRRIAGQPTLTTNQVYFTCGRVPQSIAEIRGLVCEDITGGQEDVPIPATNLVDDPPVPPTGFKYCKTLKIAKNVKLPMSAPGCECKNNCVDPEKCECARRNGGDFPYVTRDGGRLVEAKDVVFECGPECGCPPGCVNRTSQKSPRYRLEVFKTAKKGWAVRSWDFIPSGAPVCEYTGILARAEDMESVLENNYIFEIDCLQTIEGIGGRERRSQNVALPANLLDKSNDQDSESAPEFCIDAGHTGNIARFINHCCEPNLFVQCVLSTHHDLKLARVMLFAADNIPPLQELTYDYGYALDSVFDSEGKVKQMPCYCGAAGCRKRLF